MLCGVELRLAGVQALLEEAADLLPAQKGEPAAAALEPDHADALVATPVAPGVALGLRERP
jgi:hypothetical protein